MIAPEPRSLADASSDTAASAEQDDRFYRIGNIAVQKAQAESRRLGVPNVYFINGEPWYELPSGELSREDPWRGQLTPPSPTSPEPPS